MLQDITFVIVLAIVVVASVWVIWYENHGANNSEPVEKSEISKESEKKK